MLRVAGVVGWDEGAFAVAGCQGPAVAGLEVVVVFAEWVELVQAGAPGAGPGLAVVVFDPGAGAAGDGAAEGLVQASAMRWAAVGPQPRWVTWGTSTPRVMTSLSTDSPSRSRATGTGTGTGTGPTPVISHNSPLARAPRRSAARSTRSNAR
jgi:hypothetical protein